VIKTPRNIRVLFAFVTILSLILIARFRWQGYDEYKRWPTIIEGDGNGYYAYLPAVFLYQDFSFSFLVDQKHPELHAFSGGFLNEVDSCHRVNKYFCGEALLLSPFFLTAIVLSKIVGFPIDGYSFFFQLSVSFAALFYLLLGLYFLYRLFRISNISDRLSGFILVLLLFGTNLAYYAFIQPAMSHVYSFSLISMFLYHATVFFQKKQLKGAMIATFLLALIVLVRPVNIMILAALPFTAGTFSCFWDVIKATIHRRGLLIMTLIFISIISLQFIFYRLETGSFLLWSYSGEKFDWGNPHWWKVLWSYRKGFFIYTPLFLHFLISLLLLAKQHRGYRSLQAFFFFCIISYVISSWWNWYYGDSFGQRPFIDYYSFFALVIAKAFETVKNRWIQLTTALLALFLLVLNLMQSYQYDRGIMHRWAMNKEKYWYIFMHTAPHYIGCLGGGDDLPCDVDLSHPVVYNTDMESAFTGAFIGTPPVRLLNAHSGQFVSVVGPESEYSACMALKEGADQFSNGYVEVEAWKYDPTPGATNEAYMVISIDSHQGGNYFYYPLKINDIPSYSVENWQKIRFSSILPAIPHGRDEIKVYFWSPKKERFYIDDLSITLYRKNVHDAKKK
jgi:hypothetical protein